MSLALLLFSQLEREAKSSMSTELQTHHNHLETEIVSREMLSEAVNACLPAIDDTRDRALELVTPEEVAACETEASDDEDDTPEVETAEEISLKNGVYHEIKQKLNERYGIPPHEIAFIHEADTPAKKAALFKAVNAGRVRVLLGSTSKLGTGVNVQKRLVALHHVDEPWKPAELEQREGRILRQGNIYPEAFVFHYVTERSFDGYMLQTLESKARFISQIMAGEVTARTAEDVGDMVLTVAQVKAIASGNPMVQKRIELEVKLVKLDRLRAAYYNNRAAMRADLEELPERILAQEAELRGHEEAIKARLPLEDDAFRITLKKNLGDGGDATFDKRERAGAHLRFLAELLMDRIRRGSGGTSLTEEIGSYRGFKVSVHVSGNSRFAHHSTLFNYNAEIHLRASDNGACYIAQIGESNVGITQSIDYQLRHLEDRLEQTRSGLEMLKARLLTVHGEVDKPWAHAREYARLRRQYEEMGAALQSEGIEIDSNTTFTAEGEACAEESIEVIAAEAAATEETNAGVVDELAARSNPFTGLEDFPIVVHEETAETEDFDGSPQIGTAQFAAAFDFEAFDEKSQTKDETNEPDIFLSSLATEEIAKEEVNCSLAKQDSASSMGDGTNDDAIWKMAEPADKASSANGKAIFSVPRLKQSRKAKTATANPQTGFLW